MAKKNNVSIHYVLKDEELKAVENLKYKCYYIGSGKYGKYGIKVALDDVTFLIPFNISKSNMKGISIKEVYSLMCYCFQKVV